MHYCGCIYITLRYNEYSSMNATMWLKIQNLDYDVEILLLNFISHTNIDINGVAWGYTNILVKNHPPKYLYLLYLSLL